MNESYLIQKERCPECAKLGKDLNGDNLAIYSDGHKYCYSCGYTVSLDRVGRFTRHDDGIQKKKEELFLPTDCDIVYPRRCLDWIEKYELTRTDLLNHNVMWSESMQRLIFPVYGSGNLIAWQGRSFHLGNQAVAKIPKWFGKGNLKDTFNILGKGNKLIICEDIISAIKVSKCGVMTMPLYGSFIGRERFKRLFKLFGGEVEVWVWLDYDKAKEATKESKLGVLCGLNCNTIITKLDPKEMSYEEIKNTMA